MYTDRCFTVLVYTDRCFTVLVYTDRRLGTVLPSYYWLEKGTFIVVAYLGSRRWGKRWGRGEMGEVGEGGEVSHAIVCHTTM